MISLFVNVVLLMSKFDDVEGRKTIFVTKKIPSDSTRLLKQSIAPTTASIWKIAFHCAKVTKATKRPLEASYGGE